MRNFFLFILIWGNASQTNELPCVFKASKCNVCSFCKHVSLIIDYWLPNISLLDEGLTTSSVVVSNSHLLIVHFMVQKENRRQEGHVVVHLHGCNVDSESSLHSRHNDTFSATDHKSTLNNSTFVEWFVVCTNAYCCCCCCFFKSPTGPTGVSGLIDDGNWW